MEVQTIPTPTEIIFKSNIKLKAFLLYCYAIVLKHLNVDLVFSEKPDKIAQNRVFAR